ncbi:MAG: metal ABC transporter substrate-binding protein [Thermotogota bacterium]|nr:metal ABC transporter substrate-binding protein [Thermotogota bacterium]
MMRAKILLTIFIMLLYSVFSINIATTINPYYLIVKELVNNSANISVIIEPGENPHTYSPTINDIKKLRSADLILANGLSLELYLEDTLKDINNQNSNVLYVSDLIENLANDVQKENSSHINPHIWLSLDFMIEQIIPGLTDKLIEVDSANKAFYRTSSEKLIEDLSKIRNSASTLLKDYKGTNVLLSHPSFKYFFTDFGIKEYAIFEGHGDEPTIKELRSFIEKANNGEFIAIFGEKQQNIEPVQVIVKSTNLNMGILDPLGVAAQNIVELFIYNLKEIEEALNE